MRPLRVVLAAWVLACACPSALADRSRLADDAEVVEAGDCALEWALERQHARGTAREREASIELDCGVGWQSELAAAFARRRSDGEREQAITLEARTVLREPSGARAGWALVYGVAAERAGGGPWRRSEHFVAVEATLQPGPAWLVEATLGTAREQAAHRDATPWTLAVEHTLTDRLELRAELAGEDSGHPLASIGLRAVVWPEDVSVLLSYGARGGPLRERRVGLALTVEF